MRIASPLSCSRSQRIRLASLLLATENKTEVSSTLVLRSVLLTVFLSSKWIRAGNSLSEEDVEALTREDSDLVLSNVIALPSVRF
jgi:hypothetical protein